MMVVNFDMEGECMNREYGYCRISTGKQSIERQVRNVQKAYPRAIIVREVYTGTKFQGRRELDKVLAKIEPGDTLIFDSVSRMSRNAEDGVRTYFDLYAKGVALVFLKEPYIDTSVFHSSVTQTLQGTGNDIADIYIEATNRVIRLIAEKQIITAFEQAEKEVADLHQRTKEGIETARLNGKQIGQRAGAKLVTKKSIKKKEMIKQHAKAFGGSLNDVECIGLTQLSRNTYYKYKRELKEDMERG